MIITKGLTAATLAALVAATLTTALPAAARGPGMGQGIIQEGMMGAGMRGQGPFLMLEFDAIDTDKDGKITVAELDAHRAAAVVGTDANNDGKLSAEELAAQDLRMMTERANTRAARMIETLDTDGDSLLSAAEMAARPMPDRIFDRLDADGDGAITKAEAETARTRMAERMEGGRRHGKSFYRGDDN